MNGCKPKKEKNHSLSKFIQDEVLKIWIALYVVKKWIQTL